MSEIVLIPATPADQSRLENLLELYLHDFSEIVGFTPGEDGRFGYAANPFFTEPGRFPFLIRADNQLAGFALLSLGSQVSGDPSVYDVTEFFVVRGLRRHGVGMAAAHRVFASFAGTWEVRVMERNTGALVFWERVVAAFAKVGCEVFTWQSPRRTSFRVYRFVSSGDRS